VCQNMVLSHTKLKPFFVFLDPWNDNFRPSSSLSSSLTDDGPVFDNSLVTNVTAQLGGTAHLQCKVINIKQEDNPVSLCM